MLASLHLSPKLATLTAGVVVMAAALFSPADPALSSPPAVGSDSAAGLTLDGRLTRAEARLDSLERGTFTDWQKYGTMLGAILTGASGLVKEKRRRSQPRTRRRARK